jgi:hypothetical protein
MIKYDRINELLSGIIGGNTDPGQMQELLILTAFLQGSLRLADVRRKFATYQTLSQPAAKQKSWLKMCQTLGGVRDEVRRSRAMTEDGGGSVQ